MVPLLIVLLVLFILFEVYKSSFEQWVTPLTDWLDDREAWSWVIPVVILLILSFPPLFGHEIVLLVVGVSYSFSSSSPPPGGGGFGRDDVEGFSLPMDEKIRLGRLTIAGVETNSWHTH